jgi:CubicO group peptidase (beta-lactamase class C family)
VRRNERQNRYSKAGNINFKKLLRESQNTIQFKISVTMSYKVSAICMKVMIVAGFLLLLQPVFAQNNFQPLDEVLKQNQKLLGTNVAVMVWKGDTIVYKKEMGDFNTKTAAPIASASKWLTAALVMMFVEEGKISLDDKITKWLPEFAKYGKNYITIRICLSHMTGIQQDEKLIAKLLDRKKYASLEEEVNSFAAKEIQTNPGTEFRYGDIGIDIAGRVLEVVSKKRFDLLIRQKLLVPLGMRRTTFSDMEGGAVNPSAGAQSTAEDYIKFLAMLLHKGKFAGKQILSEESVNQLIQVTVTPDKIKYAPKLAQGYSYALGSWVLEMNADGKATTLPVVNYCRDYAYIILTKTLLNEEKGQAYGAIRDVIDQQFASACK